MGPVRRWVLLNGSRVVLTGVFVVATYVIVGPVGHALLGGSPPPGDESFRQLLVAFLGGDFLLVSIVVSINSLFITQEQTALGQQLDRIEAVGEFRREFESLVDAPISPAEPARFLQLVTGRILSETQQLSATSLGELAAEFDRFIERLGTQTEAVNDELRDAETTLDLVLATLAYDYSVQVNELRRIRTAYGDQFSEADITRADRILDLLRHFATAREYFKTLYLTGEFAELSNRLLYLSLPVIGLVSFVLLHTASIPNRHDVVTAVAVIALAPFFLLAAYAVRVATITKRTRAAGQFVVEARITEQAPTVGREDHPEPADGEAD